MRCAALSAAPAFLLPVRVLGKLFRRLFLTRLLELHEAGRLQFFGEHLGLVDRRAFLRYLAPVREKRWVVYAKPPFAGPEAVLAYLSRYTHRVAISNRRLISLDETNVTFRYKDYRRDGDERHRTMTLAVDEFIRRFLLHVLPKGFHRIRHSACSQGADAGAIFSRAIEAAPKAKTLYQGLMRHHLLNGREREGLAVYARLRTVFGDDAGTAPPSAMRSDGLAWARH